MKRKYFFDLDQTLVDTSELRPYAKTKEGKEFIAENPDKVPTRLIDKDLRKLVTYMHKKYRNVFIATNASYYYANSILAKHAFPDDLPVLAGLGKPLSGGLYGSIQRYGLRAADILMIGDSAVDIIAAHGCRVASVGTMWGNTSSEEQLKRAEPAAILKDPGKLDEIVKDFENDNLGYSPRKDPDNYNFFQNSGFDYSDPEVNFLSIGNYKKFVPGSRDKFSGDILRFKNSRNLNWEYIKNGAVEKFFHKGQVKGWIEFRDVINRFYNRLCHKIESMQLNGNTFVIASPNSAPEFCYLTDINQLMAYNLNKKTLGLDVINEREVFRVYPKETAHKSGARSESEHYRTIGIRKDFSLPLNLKNMIIFDDINTTGTQMRVIATMLRRLGFNGSIYALTIGQTAENE